MKHAVYYIRSVSPPAMHYPFAPWYY